MDYKTYSEELLDDQLELVTKITKDWTHFNYPADKEGLKNTYSREGFTPETRHYAYLNGKLVGFISSAIENEQDGIE